ncbi:FadR/GntR family transcriptional regulator [Bacillus solimangrovi]|uniref:HTH gntR-type domain-containing protein n=1 Tax=Bacillus solimangrovi TaxID=1305675 RepID=A0A1E5LD01_9BACI|nr:GntR family transcriptional regulator [Bacillus solimangrovi]OEH91919.1 hypothetical protein BFG57_03705 [Bacillus solimangrovi]
MKQKVYVEILQQLRNIIEEDGLQQDDKLPSERELAERLQVARSSVREALRSLELVGLIETRRGEGTFIKDARSNELIQVISAFVLQENQAQEDLKETIEILETQIMQLALGRINQEKALQLQQVFHTLQGNVQQSGLVHMRQHERFYRLLVEITDNYLLIRIWTMLNSYYQTVCGTDSPYHFSHYETAYQQLMSVKKVET